MKKWLFLALVFVLGLDAAFSQRGLTLRPDLVLPPPLAGGGGTSKECEDSKIAKSCKAWKQIGYCRKNSRFYEYMVVYCKKTCNLCDGQVPCKDDPNYEWMCPTWKKSGSCKITTGVFAAHIRQYCKKTCGFCKGAGSKTTSKENEKAQINPPECGKGKGGINIQPGGGTAQKNSWPWQMALTYYKRFFCGATLIAKQWALTAAHCVETKADIPEEVVGIIGEHDMYADEGKEIKITAKKIIIHPGYSESPLKDDIALIKFKLPIAYNDYIKPACLPTTGERPSIGQYCFTSGWGRIRQRRGGSFRFLQEISIPVVRCGKCAKSNGFKIDSNSLCAGFPHSDMLNGCTSDSGGPLNCESTNFTWKLQGILSWGHKSCPPARQYKVYTRVDAYMDWIKNELKKG